MTLYLIFGLIILVVGLIWAIIDKDPGLAIVTLVAAVLWPVTLATIVGACFFWWWLLRK